MELLAGQLKLIELSLSDLEDIHELHSFPEVDEFNTLGIPETILETETLLKKWLESSFATPRTSYIFCVKHIETNKFIGLIALNLGKLNYRIAEVWYKIHPLYWRQGFATQALTTILNFGFSDLHLHRIEAGCAVENIGSIKVLEKVGMVREGRKRQILPIRGQWIDNYIYSVVETDYNS